MNFLETQYRAGVIFSFGKWDNLFNIKGYLEDMFISYRIISKYYKILSFINIGKLKDYNNT